MNPVRRGCCKECIEFFNLNETTQVTIPGEISPQIWECPYCDYPNNIYDFHDLWTVDADTNIILPE